MTTSELKEVSFAWGTPSPSPICRGASHCSDTRLEKGSLGLVLDGLTQPGSVGHAFGPYWCHCDSARTVHSIYWRLALFTPVTFGNQFGCRLLTVGDSD